LAQGFLNPDRPGDHNQAMMELGAIVCRSGSADCGACPLAAQCRGKEIWWTLPDLPPARRSVPVLHEARLLLIDPAGQIAWRRRPVDGLYANLPDLPLAPLDAAETAKQYGTADRVTRTEQRLSHRQLQLDAARIPVGALPNGLIHGSVSAFLAEGPPTPVARLVRALMDDSD
jgi:A/G-specific adenine glycosylase